MDPERFGPNRSGTLVRIDVPKKDWAFVPNDMPPQWTFNPSLWPLLADAKESLGTLNGIGQTLPDAQLLLYPLQNREAITSSSIEGTFVTPEQLLLYELNQREPKSPSDKAADWREVFNYGKALRRGCELLNSLPIVNRVLREMHGILMEGVRGANKAPGEFRKCQVQIGSGGRFIPPPHTEIERLMANLERYVNAPEDNLDPLVRSYLVHYQFEAIHPFLDGNGRVGRLLLALMIYKTMGHTFPWLYMSAFYERYRDEYMSNLFSISADGTWDKWLEFCLRGTIDRAKDAIRRCARLNQLRGQFDSRIDAHTPRTHRIVESLFHSPFIDIPSVAERFHVQYATARSDLEKLVNVGILKEVENYRPRSFFSPEIMDIAYGEQDEPRK